MAELRPKLPPLPPEIVEGFVELMQKPVSFFPSIARLCGSATAGLMLCQGMFWSRNEIIVQRGGWFYKTAKEWEKETCLSLREQQTARMTLKDRGFWEEKKQKVDGAPTMHFRVNFAAIVAAYLQNGNGETHISNEMTESPDQTSDLAETPEPEMAKKEIRKTPFPTKEAENTAENTTNGFADEGFSNSLSDSQKSIYPSPTTASNPARARQKPLRFSPQAAPRQKSLPGLVRKKPGPLTFPEELAHGLREIWLPTDNQAIAQIWRECRANVPDLTVSELMFFAWEKAGAIKNGKTPVGLMIHSLPLACNPQGVDALREDMRKREATRRAEIEQQEAEERRWREAEDRKEQAGKLAEEKLDTMAEAERTQLLQQTRAQLLRENPSYSVAPNFEQTVRGCTLVKFRQEFETLLWKESWKKSSTMGSGP